MTETRTSWNGKPVPPGAMGEIVGQMYAAIDAFNESLGEAMAQRVAVSYGVVGVVAVAGMV